MRNFFTSLKRSPYQSLASFLMLFLSIFLSSVLLLFLLFLYGLADFVEAQPQVAVYFKTDADSETIAKIHKELLDSGKTRKIKYISKEEAFNIYKNRNSEEKVLLEMIDQSMFPVSLNIFAKNPIYLTEIAAHLEKQSIVEDVQFNSDIVKKLLHLTNAIRLVTLSIVIFLFVIATLVMITTILFKISLKKDEFELLQLLGASNFYIKRPFYWESLVFAFFSATCAFGAIIGMLWQIQPWLKSYMQDVSSLTLKVMQFSIEIWPINPYVLLGIFLISVVYGTLIGVVATSVATRKYLS